jgi:inward rectifier potassium channel
VPGGISNANDYWDCFFFSVQTWATIGYGGMTPSARLTNVLVVVESLVGIFSVAVLTGLFFAKFSRTTSRVLFASKVVISVRNGKRMLTIRVGNERLSMIAEASARVTLLRDEVTAEGERMRRMYDLPLVRSISPFFVLSWTIMHEIDERSAMHGLTSEMMVAERMRLGVNLVGFDSSVGQTAHASIVYAAQDVLFGYRYADTSAIDEHGRVVLDYAKFHDVVKIGDEREGGTAS